VELPLENGDIGNEGHGHVQSSIVLQNGVVFDFMQPQSAVGPTVISLPEL
jgi:hypothetical protein